jgi:SpoVK/Ycf46/Vps4 family AAA+-type ATPase
MEFIIQHMATQKHWADIVLNFSTLEQIDQLRDWLRQHRELAHTTNKLQDGYIALFYGPEGTGKSLSAAILANESGLKVYKIDLSQVVSKYIGETEKNLELLFSQAEKNNWILFFDEADALFGKRTGVKDSHDRYANQEVNYLLKKIENYDGLVIVASNSKSNIDSAFIRRFQSIIHFPLPTAAERKRIWETGFSENNLVLEKIDLDAIAREYELSPASIINVVHYITIKNNPAVTQELVIKGVQHEFALKAKHAKE